LFNIEVLADTIYFSMQGKRFSLLFTLRFHERALEFFYIIRRSMYHAMPRAGQFTTGVAAFGQDRSCRRWCLPDGKSRGCVSWLFSIDTYFKIGFCHQYFNENRITDPEAQVDIVPEDSSIPFGMLWDIVGQSGVSVALCDLGSCSHRGFQQGTGKLTQSTTNRWQNASLPHFAAQDETARDRRSPNLPPEAENFTSAD
jgi:hypothetical protein